MEYTTRNGICNNLKASRYKVELDGTVYYFSSLLHSDKFLQRYEGHRKKVAESLTKRFKLDISCNSLADLTLYRQIEGRGFYVSIEGEGFEWPDGIRYDGGMLTRRG